MFKIQHFRVLRQDGGSTRGTNIMAYKLKYDASKFEGASCAGIDTDVFYPNQDVFSTEELAMVKRVCTECPVMEACLEWALVHERYGVWGGTVPVERQRIRRRHGIMVSDPDRFS